MLNLKPLLLVFSLVLLLCPSFMNAQDDEDREGSDFVFIDPAAKKGFMFGLNIGGYLPNDEAAVFYDGRDKGEGFLDLGEYIFIPNIRDQIFQELGNSVSEYYLVEYPLMMRYQNTVSLGGNLRYQFDWANALVLDAFFVNLKTVDAFVLGFVNDNGTSQDIFESFEISGREERLNLSLGYQVSLAEPTDIAAHFEFGPVMTSVKIRDNRFTVGSRSFNILRAQTVGAGGNQILNNNIPNITSFGAYAQFGINMEFDKFTVDLDWRSMYEKIQLSESIEAKYRLNHLPMIRFVYRVSVKGF